MEGVDVNENRWARQRGIDATRPRGEAEAELRGRIVELKLQRTEEMWRSYGGRRSGEGKSRCNVPRTRYSRTLLRWRVTCTKVQKDRRSRGGYYGDNFNIRTEDTIYYNETLTLTHKIVKVFGTFDLVGEYVTTKGGYDSK